MTPKQYLKQGWRLKELIQTHRDELKNLRELVGSMPASGNRPGGTPSWNGNTAEQARVIKAIDLENRITEEIAQMVAVLQEIHEAIEAVPDKNERLVLRCRYILFLSWGETADRMNYSYQQVRRIHGSALQHTPVPERYRDPTDNEGQKDGTK